MPIKPENKARYRPHHLMSAALSRKAGKAWGDLFEDIPHCRDGEARQEIDIKMTLSWSRWEEP